MSSPGALQGWWHYLFPWVALHRVRLHIGNPQLERLDPQVDLRGYDAGWDDGYSRAMYDIARSIGVDRS